MNPFRHGGDIDAYPSPVLDFSANLNPLGFPPGVKEAIRSAADQPCRYPDPFCRKLAEQIAQHEQVPTGWVLCGNGAADLIYRLVWAVKPRRALLVSPCFSEYEAALQTVGAKISYHSLRSEEAFCLTARILQDLTLGLDCIFLCSPNNPTGLTIAPELLEPILQRAAQIDSLVVADECFLDLLDDPSPYTFRSYLGTYPNLILLKAFTKTYAMAGLRLGYTLCADLDLLGKIRECGQPWPVSLVAQAAGMAALLDSEYLPQSRAVLHTEREFLKAGLARCGCQVWDSQANYLFFRAWPGLEQALLAHQILIRCCGDYRGLDASFYRVAVRLRSENEKLIHTLEEIGGRHERK